MNDPKYNATAVSIVALYDALLYFDRVIPITGPLDLGLAIRAERQRVPDKYELAEVTELAKSLLFDVLPEHLQGDAFTKKLTDLYKFLAGLIDQYMAASAAGQSLRFERSVLAPYEQFVDEYKLRDYPLCTLPQFFNEEVHGEDDLSMSIASLRLINVSATTLTQLREFSRDREAKLKLRRLRLFVYENYAGKSRAYIEDDIQKRLADYDSTVKKWGFETKAAVFTNLIDSKMIAGGVAGSFLTAYLQEPNLTIASAMLTAGLTIGTIAIEIGKRRFALKELATDNPVSYVRYAQEKLDHK